jgi:hypothetical protein
MEQTIRAGGSPTTRPMLRALMVLGVIVTLVSGTGLFAVFSDRATTGQNDVSSGELPNAADLQIATASIGDANVDGLPDVVCDTFTEDLVTGLFSLSDLQPGYSSSDAEAATMCLRNVGSSILNLSASAIDLTDADISCTGDEAASGDLTCGPDATMISQAGELSPLITVNFAGVDCADATVLFDHVGNLADLAITPMAIDAHPNVIELAPGDTACYSVRLGYPIPASGTDVQLAQSDQVQWRFAFDGAASA